jgi:hypothetical protein
VFGGADGRVDGATPAAPSRLRGVRGRGRGRVVDAAVAGALPGEEGAVARAFDVDADRRHGEAVEDGGGESGVAEVAAPLAELDVGGDRSRGALAAAVEEVEEHVRGGWLVVAPAQLAQPDVVDDEPLGAGPAAQPRGVGAVGEAGVEVVHQVDAAGVARLDLALTGTDDEGLEDVALAGAVLAGDEDVLVVVEEAEGGEALDGGAVEALLEGPVEALEGLADLEAARIDAPLDATLADPERGVAEDALEQDEGLGPLGVGPAQVLLEVPVELAEAEPLEVFAQLAEEVVVSASSALGSSSLGGHLVSPRACAQLGSVS